MAMPEAVACTAPHAPSTRPANFSSLNDMAMTSMPTENKPLEKPIKAVPLRNNKAEDSGAEKITKDFYMSAQQAIELGVIDKII